ncbi:MAG TPA: serine/threonine-protein kinase [Thermoguttaceae bacterium]|nr:serine/threonine-protein kinase [Thermoguttaceae bacterium]
MNGRSHAPPPHLGQYRIVARIGSGTLGELYKGYEEALDRVVAIKVLPARLARDAELVRRFRAEATSAAKVVHPNVVPIHFIGQESEHHFLVRQYIEGESLAERLADRGQLELDRTLHVLEHCLAGHGAVHAHGLIHRGIKPGNILIETRTGRAMLVDFGLAHGADASTPAAYAEIVLATVDYLPPEQARHEPVARTRPNAAEHDAGSGRRLGQPAAASEPTGEGSSGGRVDHRRSCQADPGEPGRREGSGKAGGGRSQRGRRQGRSGQTASQ